MAEENSLDILHRIPFSGKFSDIANWLNENFHLIELAIKQNTGKSAYEVWRDYEDEQGNQPNIDKTEEEFLASLKESGYKMQAVTVRPSTIAGIEADKIYLYPDGTGQFSTAIYTGDLTDTYDSTKWIVLATNPGDLSGAFTDINGLRTDVNNLSTLVGYFTCATAAATAAKTVQATNYELTTGGNIRIKMEHANTAASPVTLQIGNATAKDLYYNDSPVTDENTWEDNETIVVYYDGTKYLATNSLGGGKKDDDLSQFFDVIEEQVGESSNLINPAEYEYGYIDSDGTIKGAAAHTYCTTGYIEVEEGKTYTFLAPDSNDVIVKAPIKWVSEYDSSKTYINRTEISASQFTAGSGVRYVRLTPPHTSSYITQQNTERTGLFEGSDIAGDDFEAYSEPTAIGHLELNDNNKEVSEKSDRELVTKKNLTDYVGKQMEGIPDISGLSDIVSAIKQKTDMLGIGEEQVGGSSNLINPEEYEYGYLDSDGTIKGAAAHTYCTTGYIEVEEGKTYTFLAPDSNDVIVKAPIKYVAKWGSSDNYIGRDVLPDNTKSFTVDENSGVAKIRITPRYYYLSQGNTQRTGLFEGADVDGDDFEEYAPKSYRNFLTYNPQVDLEGKGGKELVVKDDIPSEEEGGGGTTPDTGGNFTLLYSVGSGSAGADVMTIADGDNSIACTFDKTPNSVYDGSHVFNFLRHVYKNVTIDSTDDVPPMHVMGGIMGGNHTITAKKVTTQSYSFDDSDIGGIIKAPDYKTSTAANAPVLDGGYFIIIRVVGSHVIWCLPRDTSAYSASYFKIDYSDVAQYNNQSIIISSAEGVNLFPDVCSQLQKVVVDGKGVVLQDNDVIACKDHVDIIDSYNIVDFDYSKENLDIDGSGNMVYESPLFIRVNNTYRFMAESKVLVIASATFAKSTYFSDVMFAQAAAMIPYHSSTFQQDIQTVSFYIPGSTTVNGVNYAEPHNFVYKNPDTYNMDSTTWADQTKPVTRIIQMTQAGLGFAMGYLPVGVGADLLHNTSTPFELRGNSGKIYPHGIDRAGLAVKDGNNIPANSSYTAVMYRIFFDATNQGEGRICLYDVDYNGYKYVFVDYSQTIFDYIELDNSLNGHSIELIEQRNAVLTSPVYNGGFYVNATHVSGDSSYCVVKIKL